ncbi:neutral zinc metallopeptidase [Nocardiopsis alba]|uniref:Neutral zinc metallopeptidase n=2 Tax=Nocardiopsis alba TaxID=53437 RepID=A0ABV5E104_9ACTN|nr:neutral zinc metallopeptidase [Nocardiopsis alba]AFR08923.1 neutral zinc metallopeptidase family protein [Nocardiopsis alba ATCC BAA-2165]
MSGPLVPDTPDGVSRLEHARRTHRTHRRVLGAVCGLLVALLALSLLAWSTAREEGPASETVAGASGNGDDSPGPDGAVLDAPTGRSGPYAPEVPDRPVGETALVANPLYDTGRLSPLPCPVPELDVDVPGSMEHFLHMVADCLDDAWQTQFERAGIPFDPPNRVFWTEPGESPCRSYPSAAGAFYCRASGAIYIGTEDVVDKWNGSEDSVVYASLLAHEYGHHVQGESGLLEYYHDQRRLEETDIGRNAWTRRSELQANCLAGAFLGSVRVSYPLSDDDLETLLDDAAATADREEGAEEERTHGSIENSVTWTREGWEGQSPGSCNTWDLEDDSLVD